MSTEYTSQLVSTRNKQDYNSQGKNKLNVEKNKQNWEISQKRFWIWKFLNLDSVELTVHCNTSCLSSLHQKFRFHSKLCLKFLNL